MKLIVSDASPLIVIARSGLIPMLQGLVEEVIVPATVYAECTVQIALPGAEAVRAAVQAGQIQVLPDATDAEDQPGEELSALDAGERAAIHLAEALQCPVLMDERLGRQAALKSRTDGDRQCRFAARGQEPWPHSCRCADSRSVAPARLFPLGQRGQGGA